MWCMHICPHAHKHTHTNTRTQSHTNTQHINNTQQTHIYKHTHAHKHKHAQTHAQKHTHTYNTQTTHNFINVGVSCHNKLRRPSARKVNLVQMVNRNNGPAGASYSYSDQEGIFRPEAAIVPCGRRLNSILELATFNSYKSWPLLTTWSIENGLFSGQRPPIVPCDQMPQVSWGYKEHFLGRRPP